MTAGGGLRGRAGGAVVLDGRARQLSAGCPTPLLSLAVRPAMVVAAHTFYNPLDLATPPEHLAAGAARHWRAVHRVDQWPAGDWGGAAGGSRPDD